MVLFWIFFKAWTKFQLNILSQTDIMNSTRHASQIWLCYQADTYNDVRKHLTPIYTKKLVNLFPLDARYTRSLIRYTQSTSSNWEQKPYLCLMSVIAHSLIINYFFVWVLLRIGNLKIINDTYSSVHYQ